VSALTGIGRWAGTLSPGPAASRSVVPAGTPGGGIRGHPQLPVAHDEPAHELPAHDEPAHELPAHELPAHDEPAHELPAHELPAHELPAHDEPFHRPPFQLVSPASCTERVTVE